MGNAAQRQRHRGLAWLSLPLLVGLLPSGVVAQEPPARQRPNILLCISDDMSYPHAGAYGCTWIKTPGFDRVAEQGLLFQRAYTPDAKCAPSRSVILTGRNPWQLEAAANHWPYFPPRFRVYPEVLAQHGYFVGFTGKGWAPGIARTEDGQRRSLTGRAFQSRTAEPPTRAISRNDYAANFQDFLDATPDGQPWCFWYGCHEPHRAYEFRSGVRQGGKSPDDVDKVPAFWPDIEDVRIDMLDYAYEVEHFDAHVVRMLDLLEERDLLANTVVLVTSDNGMPFPRVKGQQYELSNHLPLAVMWPEGIAAPGRAIDDYVSFVDLAPTFLELAGVDWRQSGMASTPGRSLVPLFESEKSGQIDPARDHVLVGKERHDVGRPQDAGYPTRGLVQDGWLYLRNFEPARWPAGNPETGYLNTDGSPTKTVILNLRRQGDEPRYWELCFGPRPAEELYHVSQDRDCVNNLADTPEHAERLAALRKRMEQRLTAQEDPRMLGRGEVFATYPYADDANRNFYERFMQGEKIRAGWVNASDFEPEPVE